MRALPPTAAIVVDYGEGRRELPCQEARAIPVNEGCRDEYDGGPGARLFVRDDGAVLGLYRFLNRAHWSATGAQHPGEGDADAQADDGHSDHQHNPGRSRRADAHAVSPEANSSSSLS